MGVSKVAVIGCGMMGRGIVEVAAAAGIEVTAVKATPGDLSGPRQAIEKSLARRVKRGKMTEEERQAVLGRVKFTTEMSDISEAEIVVESAVEDEALKIELLKRVEKEMHPEAVLGTNTSSLRLEALSKDLQRPGRFVGLHFFSPVPAMELVEMGGLEGTDDYAYTRCEGFCEQIGKTPVRIKASPGYVVNRLLVPYLLHGIETLESGIASAEGIDTAMKLGCAHPMGPLALSDLIGLDIVYAMAETMRRELDDPRYTIPTTLEQLHSAGQLGRKSGIGIYDYSGDKPTLNPAIKIGG
ncbi:MAG: 3-hydroxyacyl-CoA dehydrogenase NAD-binding domain-containing protein [Myxococcales bacterium]|nr:3-hydroxyacyl-CoA dehydrogenase NAD-binding domain-containing protein [Myxococcales bacterium]